MAKGIYKQAGSNNYWIRYSDGFGKLIRQSAKTSNYKQAETELIKRKNAIRDGKEPEPIKKIPNYTFAQLAEDYSKWCERQRGYRTKKGYILQLKSAFGSLPIRQLNTRLIEQYQTERISMGNKPATANRLLATLKHCIHKGYQWEMLSEETLKRIRQVKLLEENNRRLRYLSREECLALVNTCNGNTKAIVITALNTGCRKGEILSLKWDQVDLKHGFILLDITKNGERREIPLNPALKSVMQGLTRRLDIPYVFYDSTTGKPYKDIKRSFHTALKKTEWESCQHCNYERQKIQADMPGNCPQCGKEMRRHKGIKEFRFHDLRHTFASHLVMAGIDITTVSRLLGHKNLTMTLRYAHLAPDHLAKAVNALNLTDDSERTAYLLHSQAKKRGSL